MKSFGKNVLLSTNPKEIRKLYISSHLKDKAILEYIKTNNIKYTEIPLEQMNKMCSKNHQGVLFEKDDYSYVELEELFDEKFLVILDHLEDPHNFGAIIRTSEAMGIKGLIIPKDRSVSVNDTVMKTSVGTTEYVKIAKVTNLVNAIQKLKKEGFFIYGSDMNGVNFKNENYASKKALIIGNEGKGMSPLIRKQCDVILSIPMKGKVNSLNASVAAAILISNMEDNS